MADDFDVDELLEAPYRKEMHEDAAGPLDNNNTTTSASSSSVKDRRRSDDSVDAGGSVSNGGGDNRAGDGERAAESTKDKENEKKRRNRSSRSQSMDVEERREKDKGRKRDHSRSRDRKAEKKSDRERDPREGKRDRKRSPSREKRRRSKSRDRQGRSSRDKRNDPDRSNVRYNRRKSRSPGRRRRSMSPRPYRRGRTPPNGVRNRSPQEEITAEERDARTVFCMQLSQRIRARDLDEFFSSVGKVRDVRLITCNKTKRFKGIAYIEFKDPESVSLAMGLSGQRLLGIPISVQPTQAEKNRLANAPPVAAPKNPIGPMRLYVGSLHFNITEDMLRGIFEPYGQIDNIQLIMDTETGRSKGYGFITFHNADDAKKALEQLNGFELATRPMKVGNVTERLDMNTNGGSLDNDEMDRSGIDLGATGRLQLMFKLAENAGLAVPQSAANALLATAPQPAPVQQSQPAPTIATQCFLLSNMFDPATETGESWETDIQDDVIEECNKNGGVLHVFVDTASPQGHVYVKCPSIATAVLTVNALHGRWFAGRVITAAYVPLINYHGLFAGAQAAQQLLMPTRKP